MSSPAVRNRRAKIKVLLKARKLPKKERHRFMRRYAAKHHLRLTDYRPRDVPAVLHSNYESVAFAERTRVMKSFKKAFPKKFETLPRRKNKTTLIAGTRYGGSKCRLYELFPPWNVYSATWMSDTYSGRIVTKGTINKGNFVNPNPWNYTVQDERYWFGKYEQYDLSNGAFKISLRYTGYFGDLWGKTLWYPEWERNSLYNRALDKLGKKVRGDLDLSVDIAEWKQTKSMITRRGKQLAPLGSDLTSLQTRVNSAVRLEKHVSEFESFVSRLRSTPLKGAAMLTSRASRMLANGWLEYQYGWRPLMSSIYGVLDESTRRTLNAIKHIKVTSRKPVQSGNVVKGPPDSYWRSEGVQACTISCEFEVPGGFDLTRWGTLNPVGLAWELIPYSFVVDWFVDIGSYLRNLENSLLYQLRFKGGYVSELYSAWTVGIIPQQWVVNSSSRRTLYGPMTSSGEKINFYRTLLTSYPAPRRPTVRSNLGSTRMLSAAALLRQLVKH